MEGRFLILTDYEKDCISGSSDGKTQLDKFHKTFLGIVNGYDK